MLNRYLWVAISRDICPKVSERVDIFEFVVVYMDFGKGCLVDLCLHALDNAISDSPFPAWFLARLPLFAPSPLVY